ncbi:MAG: restriction endonuclease subunit S [Anaerolineae bacterium]
MRDTALATEYGSVRGRSVVALSHLCVRDSGIQTGPFGSQLHQSDYVASGVPIITVEHLGQNRIIHSDIPRVNDDDYARLSRYTLQTGDIVFSRVGSVDRRALVTEAEDGWMFSGRLLRVRPDPAKVDSPYLSYFFGWEPFREYVRRFAVGATMPSLNTTIMSDLPILVPPLPEQRAIAHILGTLDDKIENNRRMSATLEALARALYQAWFVDFEPVRAKMAGRPSVSAPRELADLFPDRLVPSELGEIPEGWRVGTIGDTVTVTKGTSYRSSELAPSDVALISLKSFERGGGYREDGLKPYTGAYKPTQEVHAGDIVMALTDVTQAGEVVGQPAVVPSTPDHRALVASLDVGVVRPKHGEASLRTFAYWTMRRPEYQHAARAGATGTTVLHLNPTYALQYSLSLPGRETVRAFHDMVGPAMFRIDALGLESRGLGALRDTLLPRLVSGDY